MCITQILIIVYCLLCFQCALRGFNARDTKMGNLCRSINVDMMHQLELKVFKTFVGIIRTVGSEDLHSRVLQDLNSRLYIIKQRSQYHNFQIPRNKHGGYFWSNVNFAAFEHHTILQVHISCDLQILILSFMKNMWLFIRR